MKAWRGSLVLMVMMFVAAALAIALRPHHLLGEDEPRVVLEKMIPKSFGGWREVLQNDGQIINPQQTELLAKLYSQTLSRTYVREDGAVIMLSIAYGANQSDGLAMHYPEVCYPAQGFQVLASHKGLLATPLGSVRVKRLLTRLGERNEPVTYWTTLGQHVVQGNLDTKLTQLKYGFSGEIPDGLLVRVSSIDREAEKAYALQAGFAAAMVAAIPVDFQLRFAGVGGAAAAPGAGG